ncbi:MFS transporter [Jatrophihabitans sp.]|uniref:MFS transporter n=1 Tax=Jatrophihabitans sp. TaxID=1932789 RepID=UPI002F1F1F65
MRVARALRSVLPPTPQERAYALITTVDSAGTGCFLTVSVVLFVRVIGVSPTQIGAALGFGGVVSLLTRVPLGRLSDRLGHRRTLIWVHLIRGAAFPAYLLIHGFAAFLVLSVFLLVMDGWESPVRKVVLYAFAAVDDRVRIAAYNRSVYNLSFAVGSLLAAAALVGQQSRLSLYLVVAGNGVSFVLAAALATRLPPDPVRAAAQGPAPPPGARFAVIGLLCGTLFLCTSLLTIGLPLLILGNYHSHQWLIGLAMSVNTIVAIAFQVRLSRGSSDIAGASRAGLRGGAVLGLACLLFFASATTTSLAGVLLLLVAVVALSVGELYASAATWGLSMSLRRHDLTAHNQSVWSAYVSFPLLIGPFLVTGSLHLFGDYGWLVLGAVMVVAASLLRPVSATVHSRVLSRTVVEGHELPAA